MLTKLLPMSLPSVGTQEHSIAAGWSASLFQLPSLSCIFSQAFQTPLVLIFLPSPPPGFPHPSFLDCVCSCALLQGASAEEGGELGRPHLCPSMLQQDRSRQEKGPGHAGF